MKEGKVELSEIQTLRNHLGGGKIKDYPLFCQLLASSAIGQPDSLTPASVWTYMCL